MTPQAGATKQKAEKLDFNNIQSCASKDTVEKVKKQLSEWEKIHVSQISDKRLVFKT